MKCKWCGSERATGQGRKFNVRGTMRQYKCKACLRWFVVPEATASAGQATPAPAPIVQKSLREEFNEYLNGLPPLPPIPARIKATRLSDMGFDTPQEMVALFSDYHLGQKTDKRSTSGLAEYNTDIARARLARWRDGLLRFSQQDQTLIKVDTLHIFALGDDMEGHGAMFGNQGLSMDMSLGFQVVGFAEDMSTVLPDLLSRYKKIKIYKVRGNHGRITARAKDDYPPDSAELFAWQIIAERLTGQLGGRPHTTDTGIRCYEGGPIEFYISPGFIMFLDILGWTFAVRHGHGIKGLAATYTGMQDSKLRMNAIVGEVINYYVKAHLHEPQSTENEIRGESIQNGCFVGPSLLSVEMARAAANLPSQEMWLMHPKYGITSRHRITLAEVGEVRQLEWVGRAKDDEQQH